MAEDNWSVPESAVLASTRDLLESDRKGILATVVAVEGSAYRRPGAKMLIPQDGEGVGSITAGCLEDEVLRLAEDVLADGHPRIETFDLVGDDDVWGLGVGCNGIIDLLLEPVTAAYEPVLDAYESDEEIASITIIESDIPEVKNWQRAYYHFGEGMTAADEDLPDWVRTEVADMATRLTENGTTDTVELKGTNDTIRLFIDGVTPPPTLVAVGTGHDVGPVVEFGNRNDFRTVVVGFRGGDATSDRFPAADEVLSTSPADICETLDIEEDTYVVVMTHNFIDDRLAVNELLKAPTPYIGLMGPRNRFEEMLDDFEQEGRTFSNAELARLYTPIGLDLGGGTPYQIAHSIVAEVLAVHNDRQPRHLNACEGPIHERVDANPAP
jgi:xanthine dehydrogenase accessory factor